MHRDIKPANLLIADDGRLKITDFGIARTESSNLTRANSVVGSPGYIAPEQYTNREIDRRVDVFSAGVLLYRMLSGTTPFVGTDDAIMYKIVYEPYKPLSEVTNDASLKPFDAVLDRALAKDPAQRYPNAMAMRSALQALATETLPEVLPADIVLAPVVESLEPKPARPDAAPLVRHPRADLDRADSARHGAERPRRTRSRFPSPSRLRFPSPPDGTPPRWPRSSANWPSTWARWPRDGAPRRAWSRPRWRKCAMPSPARSPTSKRASASWPGPACRQPRVRWPAGRALWFPQVSRAEGAASSGVPMREGDVDKGGRCTPFLARADCAGGRASAAPRNRTPASSSLPASWNSSRPPSMPAACRPTCGEPWAESERAHRDRAACHAPPRRYRAGCDGASAFSPEGIIIGRARRMRPGAGRPAAPGCRANTRK